MAVRLSSAIIAAVILGCALTSCSQSASPTPRPSRTSLAAGTITGIAAPCAGMDSGTIAPVAVTAREHGHVAATQTVSLRKDGDRYRLSLPPGQYTIRAAGAVPWHPTVNLRPGQRITVNFPDICD